MNVPKPGILLCTNGFDAYPALSRSGTTSIAVAIRYRHMSVQMFEINQSAGALTTALGVAGYLRGERLDFATTVRDVAAERYHKRFR